MKKVKPTALTSTEILETLKRSSLNTVLVEGSDDIQLYRKMEDDLFHLNIDFIQCGGRSNLLEVYKRKHELKASVLLFVMQIYGFLRVSQSLSRTKLS